MSARPDARPSGPPAWLTGSCKVVAGAALIAGLAACIQPRRAPPPPEMEASPGGTGQATVTPYPLPEAPPPMRPAPPPEPAWAVAVVPPKPRVRPAPEYPDALSTQGIEGRVKVLFTVAAEGRVRDLQVLQSTHPQFTQAVQAALARWRFEPARDASGQSVPAPVQQSFQFHVED